MNGDNKKLYDGIDADERKERAVVRCDAMWYPSVVGRRMENGRTARDQASWREVWQRPVGRQINK